MKKLLLLWEVDPPAGFLGSASGEVFSAADGEDRVVQAWCGWMSKEAHLDSKGKSVERNGVIRELMFASGGRKQVNISSINVISHSCEGSSRLPKT